MGGHFESTTRERTRRDVAAEEGDTLADAGQAVATVAVGGDGRVAVVADGDVDGAFAVAHDNRGARAGSMLDDVRERLLDDAIGGQIDARREDPLSAFDRDVDNETRAANGRHESVEPLEPRLRLDRHPGATALAPPGEQTAQLGQRSAAGGGDAVERGLGARVTGRDHARAGLGLHDDHADVVGDHVVELACDARPLLVGGAGGRLRLVRTSVALHLPDGQRQRRPEDGQVVVGRVRVTGRERERQGGQDHDCGDDDREPPRRRQHHNEESDERREREHGVGELGDPVHTRRDTDDRADDVRMPPVKRERAAADDQQSGTERSQRGLADGAARRPRACDLHDGGEGTKRAIDKTRVEAPEPLHDSLVAPPVAGVVPRTEEPPPSSGGGAEPPGRLTTGEGRVRTVRAMTAATLDTPPDSTTSRRLRPGALAPFALRWVGVVVAAKTVLSLAFAGRYGWHIDELYYFATGKHPALGHVDFPPITPLLAGVARVLFGESLVGLRSLAILAGAGVLVLAALIARELGGGRFAQTLAAASVGSSLVLGSNTMFQTVSFDQLAWAAVLFVALRLLRTGDARLWPVLGAVAGLGLMTKYTIAVLLAGLAAGFVLSAGGRARLRGVGPWLAVGIAALIFLPNLWWQIDHGWPSVDFFTSRNPGNRDEFPPPVFLAMFLLAGGPMGLALLVPGVRRLAKDAVCRPLAIAAALTVAGFVVTGGKPYYPAPLHVLLAAAGTVALEGARIRRRRTTVVVSALLLLPALPYYFPVLPLEMMLDIGGADVRRDYADQIGWPELVAAVDRTYEAIPADEQSRTAILTSNYGEAGAVDLFGPERGLPRAASPHLTYRYWTPPQLDATTLLAVGFHPGDLNRWCAAPPTVTTFTTPHGVDNEESGKQIAVCRLRGTFAEVWREVAQR